MKYSDMALNSILAKKPGGGSDVMVLAIAAK